MTQTDIEESIYVPNEFVVSKCTQSQIYIYIYYRTYFLTDLGLLSHVYA